MKKAIKTGIIFIEVIVLIFMIFMISGATFNVMLVDRSYAGYFIFTAVGICAVVWLVDAHKKEKPYTAVIGLLVANVYMLSAGFGCFVCTINEQRIKRYNYYKPLEVTAVVDGVNYKWDNQTVLYNDEKMEYLKDSDERKVFIDGKQRDMALLRDKDEDIIYVCIYSGATGEFLELGVVY